MVTSLTVCYVLDIFIENIFLAKPSRQARALYISAGVFSSGAELIDGQPSYKIKAIDHLKQPPGPGPRGS